MGHGFIKSAMNEALQKARLAKKASLSLIHATTLDKDAFLQTLAQELRIQKDTILSENLKDVEHSQGQISASLLDRLRLSEARIEAMAVACESLIQLKDPIGEVVRHSVRPNGLDITQVRVPLGVIAMIYESRPNVTIDAATLCLKAGNAVILRGGKEALHSNRCLVEILKKALLLSHLNEDLVQLIENPDRKLALDLMKDRAHIDVLIPRGSARLIQSVIENAQVPVLETGVGNCHIYVEESADLEMAAQILMNAKCSRPGVCNAAEKCLVDEKIAPDFLSRVVPPLLEAKVVLKGCEKTLELYSKMELANDEDWDTEYLDLILGIKIVKNFDEALAHIQKHSTHHSEAIITQNNTLAHRFQHELDAAALYVNASTRFTDGAEFGFGAEIGISTQKLHARGPIALEELTTTKYLIQGTGQIR